jgi:hypothetical protein
MPRLSPEDLSPRQSMVADPNILAIESSRAGELKISMILDPLA